MNKAKWMQGVGGLIAFGALGCFLWDMNLSWKQFCAMSGASISDTRSVSYFLIASLEYFMVGSLYFVIVIIGGVLLQKGQKLEAMEQARVDEPGEENLDHGWRKNPFQKGDTSDKVLPRGNFLQKRNKFRKTIERPNSQGY